MFLNRKGFMKIFSCISIIFLSLSACEKPQEKLVVSKIINSPDKNIDAVHYQVIGGGATVPIVDIIALVSPKSQKDHKLIILRGYKFKYLNFRWCSNRVLLINYDSERILEFKNSVYINDKEYIIHLRYLPNISIKNQIDKYNEC
jgi:hypothetical protein